MTNKDRLIAGGKVLAIIIMTFVAIIANAGLWNAATVAEVREAVGMFPTGVSILNFVLEAVGIGIFARYWFRKK